MSTAGGPTGPEYLESGTGSRVSPETRADNRKRLLLLGAVAGALAIGGTAAWAATSFLATGAQPAEALPAGTVGYVSIDLDPSGSQKVEAIRMLRKFPAFRDHIGLDTDDDIRERIFDEVVMAGECEGLDYQADVAPWLGSRAAIAAVDTGGDLPAPVLVVQVTDGDKAEAGLDTLRETCPVVADRAEERMPDGGGVVSGDWLLVGEDEAAVQKVVDATDDGSLADDADFQRWTAEAGDAGIMSMYLAPAAGRYLADVRNLMGVAPGGGTDAEVESALADFEGAAATVRFDGGALEVEIAGDAGPRAAQLASATTGGDVVATLPTDTIAAFGVGFTDGWFGALMEQLATQSGEDMTGDEMLSELASATGLDLPADAEALVGDSMALGLGAGVDIEGFVNGGLGELPAGVKVKGDPDEVERVLAKLRPRLGPDGALLETQTDGDLVAIGPNADYRGRLIEDGGLGDTAAYQDVIADTDAAAVLFVNFDADAHWLDSVAGDDPELADNVEPLSAFGATAWRDGDVSHGLLRLTTD